MKKTAFFIMLITISSKFLGFFREVVLSYYFGATNVTDAYLISKTIPSFMFMFIGTALVTGFIPTYSKIVQEKGDYEGNYFTSNLINVLLIICTVLVIIIQIFPIQTVKIFASGFSGQTLTMATKFTQISIFTVYLTPIIYIFTGLLQLKGKYYVPAFIGIPLSLIIITSIIITSRTNIVSILAFGYALAVMAQLVFMLPTAHKSGFRYQKYLNFNDKRLKEFMILVIPAILGVSVNQINVLVDRTLASRIAIGGISALTYANQLNLFIQGIFVTSLVTVLYPTISNMITKRDYVGFNKALCETIISISLLVIPVTIGSLSFAEPIVRLLFGRGAFDTYDISMTSSALTFYSIGMIGYGLREVLSRAFYSLQDTRTPMINAALAMVMNIILNIILSRYMGIGGLALATSISAVVCTVLLFISLRKKIGPFGVKNISISFMKILCASLMMGLIAKLSFNYMALVISQNLSLVFAIGIGTITYFIIIYFMKIEDVDAMVNLIKRKVKIRVS